MLPISKSFKVKPLALTLALILIPSTYSFAEICGMPTTANPIDLQAYRALVTPLVASMSLQQKIGQMALPDLSILPPQPDHYLTPHVLDLALMKQNAVGAILVNGGETPYECKKDSCSVVTSFDQTTHFTYATLANWQALSSLLNKPNVSVTLDNKDTALIQPLLGTDAVHGNQHVLGEVLFPHNIGLAAAHDPAVFYEAGYWTAQSVKQSGFNWVYAPTVAVSQNPQWGRFYETMGSNLQDVQANAYCYVQGAQAADQGLINGVLATVKHYVGDGATKDGIDEGDVNPVSDLARFYAANMPGYAGAINASVGSAMISYSAVNSKVMSVNKNLLDTLFTGRLNNITYHQPFLGFTVSDYGAIDKAAAQGLPSSPTKMSLNQALADSLNAGMDMVMLAPTTPNMSVPNFIKAVTTLVDNSKQKKLPAVNESVIDEAVTRILAVKYAMGLIRNSDGSLWHSTQKLRSLKGDADHLQAAAAALQAAEKSLVLLKNQHNILPLTPTQFKYIVFVGENILAVQEQGKKHLEVFQDFNNIGAQNGGWTLRWQGFNGNQFWQGANKQTSHASSILEGVSVITAPYQTNLLYTHYQNPLDMKKVQADREQFLAQLKNDLPSMSSANTLIIATLAEVPYAEFMGDINASYCQNNPSDVSKGCLYDLHLNSYLPDQQKASLAVNLDAYSAQIIKILQTRDASIPLVTVLLSGRPVLINQTENGFNPLNNSSAFVAAWLPGTTGGQAIANALFGRYLFCKGKQAQGVCLANSANTLPVDWVANREQLVDYPNYARKGTNLPRYPDPLFSMGDGLATFSS